MNRYKTGGYSVRAGSVERLNAGFDGEGKEVTSEFRFVNAPTHRAMLGLKYAFNSVQFADTRMSVNYNWQDDKFTGSIDVALWARNITDKEYGIVHF